MGGGREHRGAGRGHGRGTVAGRRGADGGTRADPSSRSARGQSEEWNASLAQATESTADAPVPPAAPPPAPRVLAADDPELQSGLTAQGRETLALLRRTMSPENLAGFLRSVQRDGQVDFARLEAGLERRRGPAETMLRQATVRVGQIESAVGELAAHTGPGRGALGDGSTEAAAMAEIESGRPTRGAWHGDAAEATVHALRGHVDELRTLSARVTEPDVQTRIQATIARAEDRLEALEPAAVAWARRQETHPQRWGPDGQSLAQPDMPVAPDSRPITAVRPRTSPSLGRAASPDTGVEPHDSTRATIPAPPPEMHADPELEPATSTRATIPAPPPEMHTETAAPPQAPAVRTAPIIPVGTEPQTTPQAPAVRTAPIIPVEGAPPSVVTSPTVPVGAVTTRPIVAVGTPPRPTRPAQGQAPVPDEEPVVLPTGSSGGETGSARPINQVALGGGATATVTHNSAQVQVTSDAGHSGQVGGTVERGPDGDVRGATVTGGGTRSLGNQRAVSGQITGGGTYYADQPQHSVDGTWRVSWRVAMRLGAEVGGERGRGSASVGGQVERSREGTDVFPTEEAATQFQHGFREWRPEEFLTRFFRAATADQGTLGFWQSAPVGTSRTVATGGQLSASASARLAGLVSVGAGIQWSPTRSSQVEKSDATTLQVTQSYQSETIVNPTFGAAGISVSGSMGLFDNGWVYNVTDVVSVNTTTGESSLTRFLSGRAALEPGQRGVAFTSHTVERGEIDQTSASLIVAGVETRSGTSTLTETSGTGADQRTRVTHRGMRRGRVDSGSTTYLDSDQLDAPEAEDRRYQYSAERRAPGEDEQSHSWRITEEFTQDQMRLVHERYLEATRQSQGDHAGVGLTCYDEAYRALAQVPTTEAGNAERARVFADLVASDGERAMVVLRSLAGGPASRTVRLFRGGVEDPNFLTTEQRAALNQRLAAFERRLQTVERADPRPPAETEVVEGLRRDQADLQARLDAIRDGSQYEDMPVPREEVVSDYQALLDRIEGLLRRALGAEGAGPPRGLSEGGFEAWYTMDSARQSMDRNRAGAERAQREALGLRGHMSSSTTGAAMESGRAELTAGRSAQTQAEDTLRSGGGDTGPARETGYRRAAPLFTSAGHDFEQSESAFRQAIARVRLEMAQAAAPHVAGPQPAADAVPASDGTAATQAPRAQAPDLRRVAERMGFPQVDLARALPRHARAAAECPRAEERIRSGFTGEVPAELVADPAQREQIRAVVAVCWYQQRHGLTADGLLGGDTLRSAYGEAGGDAALQAEERRFQARETSRRTEATARRAAASEAATQTAQYHFDRALARLQQPEGPRGLAGVTYRIEPDGPVDVGRGLQVRIVNAHDAEVRGVAGGLVGPGRQVVTVTFAIVRAGLDRTLTITYSTLQAHDDTLTDWAPREVSREEIPVEPGRRFTLTFQR